MFDFLPAPDLTDDELFVFVGMTFTIVVAAGLVGIGLLMDRFSRHTRPTRAQ